MPAAKADTSTYAVELTACTKQFPMPGGETYFAVRDIDLKVEPGRFVSIVGPTGSGKSTILNMAAGLLNPSTGEVKSFGEPVSGVNRRASYMFQQDPLLPWKTVIDNVSLGLTMAGVSKAEAHSEARRWLEKVGLKNFADRYPHQLSGGMRKRTAIAQAWIVNPDVLLMDEPFSALDVQTRQIMENELLQLWQEIRQGRRLHHARPGRGHRTFRRSGDPGGRPRKHGRGKLRHRHPAAPRPARHPR